MRELATDALVLRSRTVGDSSAIISLLTPDLGRIDALAPNARTSRRRFGGAIDLGACARVELTRRGSRFVLSAASGPGSLVASDLTHFAHASYIAELILELTPLEQPDAALFEWVREILQHIAATCELGRVVILRAFELTLLQFLGALPDLGRCGLCGSDTELGVAPQGLVCATCEPQGKRLGEAGQGFLRELFAGTALPVLVDRYATLPLSSIRALSVSHLQALLPRPLRSAAFIHELNHSVRG